MRERILATLSGLDPGLLSALTIFIASLLAFEGWVLLRAPLADYQTLASTRKAMTLSLAVAAGEQNDPGPLAAELRQVSARLAAQFQSPAPDDQIAAQVMAELDRSAGQNGITLVSFRPGAPRVLPSFAESSFDVIAQGSYLRLGQWLMDFDRTLGQNASVSELTIKITGDGKLLALTMKIGLYRPLQLPGEQK